MMIIENGDQPRVKKGLNAKTFGIPPHPKNGHRSYGDREDTISMEAESR